MNFNSLYCNLSIIGSILGVCIHETMTHILGYTDKKNYINNIVNRSSKHNILIIKVIQSLMGTTIFSPHIVEILKQNTHNVCVDDEEIDIILLEKIKKDYNIKLITNKHFHAGMISIVYLGTMDNKKVIIKLKRKNIIDKVRSGCDNINFIYKLISIFPCNDFIRTLLISFQSITQTSNYLISQCFFDNEINATITTQKEVGLYPLLKNIVIPTIYNKHDDILNTDFIIMDYLDGIFCNEIANLTEQHKYLEEIFKFSMLMSWFFTYYHTDMHNGNLIFMKENDVLKIGIIDFGMVNQINDFTREGLRLLSDINEKIVSKDEAFNIIKYISNNFDLETLNIEQKTYLNVKINELIIDIACGHFSEIQLYIFINDVNVFLNTNLTINLEIFIVLISSTMFYSTLHILAGNDDKIINIIYKKVMNEIMEE